MSAPFARTLTRLALAAAILAGAAGCQNVDFTQRRHLADPLMDLDDGPTETHFAQKTFYSREGSVGGIGAAAGGGCGCF